MESDIKQETPIQIRVRFERNEKGDIEAVFDDKGKWVLMENPEHQIKKIEYLEDGNCEISKSK